jgi:hypothetical protein
LPLMPAAGTPAASMNREVADAMLVLAMDWWHWHTRALPAAEVCVSRLASSPWMERE